MNHRYLAPKLKLPEFLRGLELPILDQLRSKRDRGEVECTLRYQGSGVAL